MTRILVFGDVGQTGFGTVTWDLGTRLLGGGHDLRFISTNQSGDPVAHPIGERTWDASQTNPAAVILHGFRDGWKPDAAIIVSDFVGLRYGLGVMDPEVLAIYAGVPTFHYCPVEGVGLPPRWAEVWRIIRPVAMSEFGAEQMAKILDYRPPVVYHGVNTDDFYPLSMQRPGRINGKTAFSRDGARQALGLPLDRVLLLRTDRHMPRKQYSRLLRSMSRVFDAVPDVDLIIHCRTHDQGGDLDDALSKFPQYHSRVKLTRAHDSYRGLSREALNVLYNAADIYVSNSAEGFGLTIAEAIAAGTPAVGIDYSSVPEVIGPAGTVVPYEYLVDNEYDHFWAAVDEEKFADAVIYLARHKHRREALGQLGPAHIRDSFSWDRAAAQFAALIEDALSVRAAA